MGKHVKKKNLVSPRSFRESAPVPEPEEDQIDFDFLDLSELEAEPDLLTEEPAEEPVRDEAPDAPAAEEAVPSAGADDAGEEAARAFLEAVEAAPAEPETAVEVREPEAAKETAPRPVKKKKKLSPEAKAKRERARSRRRFRRGLLAYVIIFLVLIIGTLVFEWIKLDEAQKKLDAEAAAEAERLAAIAEQQAYERALYQAPQLAFEAWEENADADFWTDRWFALNQKSGVLENREPVREYIENLFAGAEAFKSLDYTAQAPVYVLKNGDQTLAKITLSGADLDWTVSDTELLIQGDQSASTRVVTGSRVFCNGVELTPEYVVNSDSYFNFDALRDSLVNPVTWNTYQVDGLLLKPELTAEPPEGKVVTQTAEGDFLLCLDAAAGKTYADRAVQFVRAYLFYYLSGSNNLWGNLYNVRVLLIPGTNAYTKMGETADGVYWLAPHYNIDTSDVTAGDVVIWADNCYSVDVAYKATGIQNGQDDGYDATMRVYFQQINGTFVISDFEIL